MIGQISARSSFEPVPNQLSVMEFGFNRLVHFAPHGDQTLAQLVDVLDSALAHTRLHYRPD